MESESLLSEVERGTIVLTPLHISSLKSPHLVECGSLSGEHGLNIGHTVNVRRLCRTRCGRRGAKQVRLQFVGPRHEFQFVVIWRLPSYKSFHGSFPFSVVISYCTYITFVSGRANWVGAGAQFASGNGGLHSVLLISSSSCTNASSCRSSSSDVRGCAVI